MGEKILVIGAGHQGLAMAAHLALNGEQVNIWNRSMSTIEGIINSKRIKCEGCVQGEVIIDKISTNIEEVLTTEIMVTIPSFAHKDIAKMLAPIIKPESIVVLNPGRTFGAIEFLSELKKHGCANLPYIAETQSIIYTCRKSESDTAYIFALKDKVKIACVNGKIEHIRERMPQCMQDRFNYVDSVIETSLSNIGMILHCAPILFNVGWIESEIHEFKYYYDGISPSVAAVLERMDKERIHVAQKLGIQVESLVEWFRSAYGIKGDTIFECIQKNESYRNIDAPVTIKHRYIDEDVPNGLVPIEYIGKMMDVDVSTITQIIDLAILLRGINYREIGRRFKV